MNDALSASAATSNRFFREAEAQAIRFQRALRDTRTESERLNDSIRELTGGLDAVAGAARNVGLIGDEAANAIASVLDLGDAIAKVIDAASTGNILGLIGAGLGAIGGLFGQSETSREHERIQQQKHRGAGETAQRGVRAYHVAGESADGRRGDRRN